MKKARVMLSFAIALSLSLICVPMNLRATNVVVPSNDTQDSIMGSINDSTHFMKNGILREIDNTMVKSTGTNGVNFWQTKDAPTTVTFADVYSEKELVMVEKDGYSLSWTLTANHTSALPTTSALKTSRNINTKGGNSSKSTSTVTYGGYYDNIDLVYNITPNKVKEDIILYSCIDSISFTARINSDGLVPTIWDDGWIAFLSDSEEPVFIVPTLYMYDYGMEEEMETWSYDISAELVKIDEHTYDFIFTPSSDWLSDPRRLYPVTIDPSFHGLQEVVVSSGVYTLRSPYNQTYLDVYGANVGNGAKLWQYSLNGTAAQSWKFERQNDGSYKITTLINYSYCLDLNTGQNTNGLKVQLWTNNNTNAQRWRLYKGSSGVFLVPMVSSTPTRCADYIVATNEILFYPYHGGLNQQWVLEPRLRIVDDDVASSGIPRHPSAVSATLGNPPQNACYDFGNSTKPYSGWPTIDYNNSSGKAGTRPDRTLRRVRYTISGRPNDQVTVSTTLGSDAFISPGASITLGSDGKKIIYVESYGRREFTVNVNGGGVTASCTIQADQYWEYENRFFLTVYTLAKRSDFATAAAFDAAVRLNGSGYNDWTDKYYTLDWSSNASPIPIIEGRSLTKTGTTPTTGRTIAVDYPYVTRLQYVSDGSTSNIYHRAQLWTSALIASGDNGRRIAEDSGASIEGYHIDVYIGTQTQAQFKNSHPNLSGYITNGYYFVYMSQVQIIKG